ncbi:beta family protein [Loktanella sp. SALINAS62]|uniref:beta family protein n=1 Tax=Loktanella sp. SALINAS62 TaxID=2706124 RepID=UPI001B8CC062|nr:beta family protein [Loktanella sp. SALINAS62]MBS1303038.1 hypothetical protein [Loktanella sp. SALINAS62]
MVLENTLYVPTLSIRPAEMRGLEYLAQRTKDRMTPCFLLAPWVGSATLQKAVERLETAFPVGQYFLDLDRLYMPTNLDHAAQSTFVGLSASDGSYRNWQNFIREVPRAMPVLQLRGLSSREIIAQIEAFQAMQKTFAVRICDGRVPENVVELVEALNTLGTADYALILDAGWTRNPLGAAAWYSGLLRGALTTIDAQVPAVVSCTSIPKAYAHINGLEPVSFSNRRLVNQVQAGANRARIIYGDWGSTRPRDPQGGGGRPPPRIDYSLDEAWCIARNPEEDWDFTRAAAAIVESDYWDGTTDQWAEEMIAETAENEALGINTAPLNVACRVNLHLHRQAFYGDVMPRGDDLDEPYEDI